VLLARLSDPGCVCARAARDVAAQGAGPAAARAGGRALSRAARGISLRRSVLGTGALARAGPRTGAFPALARGVGGSRSGDFGAPARRRRGARDRDGRSRPERALELTLGGSANGCAPHGPGETIHLFFTAPADVARLFKGVLATVQRRIERKCGRTASESEALDAML